MRNSRPHAALVEVRIVAEAERRVPRLKPVRVLEEADHSLASAGLGFARDHKVIAEVVG